MYEKFFVIYSKSLKSVVQIKKAFYKQAIRNKSFIDFEDSLQHQCALEESADYIITRNKKDFLASKIAVYTPAEFLQII